MLFEGRQQLMGEVGAEKSKGQVIEDSHLYGDILSCNVYNYGDAGYWDTRYLHEAGSFDWYQRYSNLRPYVRKYIPTSARVLMVGCGNAVMSEDMVNDGFEDIINIDISSVVIEMMRKKYSFLPQLKYFQMDVRDMSFFPNQSFDSVIDKGTLDSLMCGDSAPISASRMLAEVSRLLKHGGIYMLITYGDPKLRLPHLNEQQYGWKIKVHVIPRPEFQQQGSSSQTSISCLQHVSITADGTPSGTFGGIDPHYIYVCQRIDEAENTEEADI